MTEHTRAERDAINRAFDAIAYQMECWNHSAPIEWRDAFAYERRQRGLTTSAKALMVDGFRQGVQHNPRAHELASYSLGIRTAICLGAAWYQRRVPEERPSSTEILKLCDASQSAHEGRQGRAWQEAGQ